MVLSRLVLLYNTIFSHCVRHTIIMSSKQGKHPASIHSHSKRCSNPLNLDSHCGKNLQLMSIQIQEQFGYLPPHSIICASCRKKLYKRDSVDHNNFITSDSSIHASSPKKQKSSSREDELEELLNGLKQKFATLPE